MRSTRRTVRHFVLLLGLLIIASGCGMVRTVTPAPIMGGGISFPTGPVSEAPTPTSLSVVLPLVMEANESPTPEQMKVIEPSPTPTPYTMIFGTEAPHITLLFTGVIVPARCVQAAIDRRGDANYVYDEVREIISDADLAVGTLNASLSDLSTPTGCTETYVLVGDSRSAAAAAQAGIDVMSVATNHIKNCNGASCRNYFNQAFLDTLENLRANNILPVGAGMDMEEALQPVVVEVQGIRFGIVSLGMIEPMAFAGETRPGIAELNEENLRASIAAAREMAEVVIVMPHWGPEDFTDPSSLQMHYARVAVEAGADVVVGNHTHVVQAIQQINNEDMNVFYGLGNFIFDQTWDLAHKQGVILRLYFYGALYTGYDLIFTHVDGDGTVHIAGEDEAAGIWQRIEEASAKLR